MWKRQQRFLRDFRIEGAHDSAVPDVSHPSDGNCIHISEINVNYIAQGVNNCNN